MAASRMQRMHVLAATFLIIAAVFVALIGVRQRTSAYEPVVTLAASKTTLVWGEVIDLTIRVANATSTEWQNISIIAQTNPYYSSPVIFLWNNKPANCAISENVNLDCEIGNVSPGATVTITVPVMGVASVYSGMRMNVWATKSTQPFQPYSPDGFSNVAALDFTVTSPPRASLSLTHCPPKAFLTPDSRTASCTVTVRNGGDGIATQTSLTYAISAGFTLKKIWEEGDAQACSLSSSNCTLGDIPPGGERVIHVTTEAPATMQTGTTATSTATVTSTNAPTVTKSGTIEMRNASDGECGSSCQARLKSSFDANADGIVSTEEIADGAFAMQAVIPGATAQQPSSHGFFARLWHSLAASFSSVFGTVVAEGNR